MTTIQNQNMQKTLPGDIVKPNTSGGGDKPDPPSVNKADGVLLDDVVTLQTSGGGDKPDPPQQKQK